MSELKEMVDQKEKEDGPTGSKIGYGGEKRRAASTANKAQE